MIQLHVFIYDLNEKYLAINLHLLTARRYKRYNLSAISLVCTSLIQGQTTESKYNFFYDLLAILKRKYKT